MTRLSEHQTDSFAKLFVVGDSGSGKTGALLSLVKAGYHLRVLDFDNGIGTLKSFIEHECPERIDQVDVEPIRDIYKMGPMGPVIKGGAKAFTKTVGLLDQWSDKTIPAEWGPEHVLVFDSLTHFARPAHAFAKALQPDWKDGRLHVGLAQDLIMNILSTAFADNFHTNVIVNCHIDHREGAGKDYVASIGKALGPKLPSIVNTMVRVESSGMGKNVKREIKTLPTGLLDLKNTAPFKLEASYPLETGLAEIFATLRG